MHRQILIFIAYLTTLYWFSTQVSRADTSLVIGAFGLLFFLYVLMLKSKMNWSLGQIIGLTVALRLAVWFGLPWLTDDYFRFIWDGA